MRHSGIFGFAVAVSVGVISAAIGLTVSAHASPRVDKKLCGVVEQGFTPIADLGYGDPGVTVGVAVRNRTNRDAVQVDLKVNAYDSAGKLLVTQEFGLQNVPARQTVVDGYTWETSREVASIKILLTCDTSQFATNRLPRFQEAIGEYTPGTDPNEPDVRGVFTNRQKTASFANIFYVFRDSSNRIVGGYFTNPIGTVPRGQEVSWTGGISFPVEMGALRVQANTSYVYSAY